MLLHMRKVLPPTIVINTINTIIIKFVKMMDVYNETQQIVLDMRKNLQFTLISLEPYLNYLNMVD